MGKIEKICLNCEDIFMAWPSNSKKFCKHKCYSDYIKGRKKLSPEAIEKLRKINTGVVFSDERKKRIGDGKRRYPTKEEQEEFEKYMNFGMTESYIVKKMNISERVYRSWTKILFGDNKPKQMKFIASEIEYETIIKIIELCKSEMRYKRIAKELNLSIKKTRTVILALEKIRDDVKLCSYDSFVTRKQSKPEKFVEDLLIENNIEYSKEFVINEKRYFSYDFRIKGILLLIEVQGDYYHCNPDIYPEAINGYQNWVISKDKVKEQYAIRNGYKVLYIWENDIKTRPEYVKNIILKEIKNEKKHN